MRLLHNTLRPSSTDLPQMSATPSARFKFIGHALRGDGPFRPVVVSNGTSAVQVSGSTALVRYPRESDQKYARRNEIAFHSGPMARACSRFTGYLSTRSVTRALPGDLFPRMAEDIDGKANSLDVFWSDFMVQAKARGSMLLLVDMPSALPATLAQQVSERRLPFWTAILPETVTEYAVGDDGKFDFVEFEGTFRRDGETIPCEWYFDRATWKAERAEKDGKGQREVLAEGAHPLRECPVLIFTEQGDFPAFGPFAALADLMRRLFNAESELDEIIRGATFPMLGIQVPEQTTPDDKLAAAKAAGETIGTQNLVVYSGSAPAWIAPPDGPARVCMDRIAQLKAEIDEVSLNVATPNQRESGLAMSMRFQAINAELARFSGRMEDLERSAWELSRRWLQMQGAPVIQWPRDFQIADVQIELQILQDMQAAGMPAEVIAEQQRRIVSVQFGGIDQERADEIERAIEERTLATRKPAAPVTEGD